jgi:lysophospholipase L1-like esterase
MIVLGMSTGAICCGGRKSPNPPTPISNPPTVVCPEEIALVSHQAQPQPTANFDTPPAQDGEPPVNVTCTPASGSEFPNGQTIVTCEAIDARARKGSCMFSVVVRPIPLLSKTRFMAFGDSLTEGKTSLAPRGAVVIPTRMPPVFNNDVSYVSQLYAKLSERYQDQEIAIIAEGYGARRTFEETDREREALDQWRPDALFLMEGTNDMINFPNTAGINTAADALQRMVRYAKTKGVRVFLATLPPMVPTGFRTSPEAAAAVPGLNARIRDLAAVEGVVLVDMYAALAPTNVGPDGVHLTVEGYGIMADEWLKAIIDTMEIKPPPAEAATQSLLPARARR